MCSFTRESTATASKKGRFSAWTAIAADWTTGLIWLPLLIGWGLKSLLIRYLGPKSYSHAMPLFLGLILGEFAVGGFWSLLAMFTRRPQYHFWT